MEKFLKSTFFLNVIKIRYLITDGMIFRLHYRVTALAVLLFSFLVTATQFFGNPIQCTELKNIPPKLTNTYCWMESTFTLPRALNNRVGIDVIYPGVDQRYPDDYVVYHPYYQFVCLVLFLQSVLFYFPRLAWQNFEDGKIKSLLQDLNVPVLNHTEREERCKRLAQFFSNNLRLISDCSSPQVQENMYLRITRTILQHSAYAYKYLFCEILTLINVVGQIFFTNYFLGGEFLNYGIDVIHFATTPQEERFDPMAKVFPKITKCSFQIIGPSGDVEKYDLLCCLPLNVINEKIYIILWFWFLILAALTTWSILCKLASLMSINVRYLFLRSATSLSPWQQLRFIVQKTTFNDFNLLILLAQNMDDVNFKIFVNELWRDLRTAVWNVAPEIQT